MRSDAQKNYDRLLAVGRDVVTEHGAEASLRDVARRADVGLGTLYRHFPTREALLEALLRERFDGLTLRAGAFETSAAPADALVASRNRRHRPQPPRRDRGDDGRHRRSRVRAACLVRDDEGVGRAPARARA